MELKNHWVSKSKRIIIRKKKELQDKLIKSLKEQVNNI